MGCNETEIPKVLVISHGSMCQGILDAAKMIGLSGDNIIAKPMEAITNTEEYERDLRSRLEAFPAGSLVLVDVFGGTPFNVLGKIIADYPLYAVTGVNLPMVLEAWSSCRILSGRKLQQAVIEAGKNGIMDVNEFTDNL